MISSFLFINANLFVLIQLGFSLKVTSILDEPFLMLNDHNATGNDKFIGYCADLTRKLAEIADFDYEIQLVKDNKFGALDGKGNWSGMIGEILANEADLAIAPLTVSSKRESAIDFSVPFMNVGISIMVQKSKNISPFFKLISPIDLIWLFLFFIYLLISIGLYLAKNLVDFSLDKSVAWWFFTLVLIGTYTLNLVLFLTVTPSIMPINSAQNLANQQSVKYGTVQNSSTYQYLKSSNHTIYAKIWNNMQKNTDVFVKNVNEGFKKVKESEGKYAFLLESSANDYLNGQNADCDTIRVGDNLDSKDYAIGLSKESKLRERINIAILKMKESGFLEELRYKWWNQRSKCNKTEQEDYITRLSFVVHLLLVSFLISVLIGIVELYYKLL